MTEALQRYRRRLPAPRLACGLLLALLLSGCSLFGGTDAEDLQTMKPEAAEQTAGEVSHGLLELTAVRGQTGSPGALITTIDSAENTFHTNDAWSIADASPDELRSGMKRLVDKMPAAGWEIESYEPANSEAKQPQLRAVHEKTGYKVFAELLIRSERKNANRHPSASRKDLISFTVTSPAYQAPGGTKIDDHAYAPTAPQVVAEQLPGATPHPGSTPFG
ncbi:hypothetical protein [Streptomyces sp. NPDC017993]|uniref:hypothetical protein n=1 Tax=Streptomyces sp. NPDC017993 TaxID=3365027 RepID=UPI00378CD698